MIIKNKDLNRMLKLNGSDYVKMMYCNRFIHLTGKQLDYVLNYKRGGEKVEKSRIRYKQK